MKYKLPKGSLVITTTGTGLIGYNIRTNHDWYCDESEVSPTPTLWRWINLPKMRLAILVEWKDLTPAEVGDILPTPSNATTP